MSSSFSVHRAAQEGQTGLVKSLLSQDPKLVNSKDADGRTPLHWAAMTDNLAVLQTILSHHPEIDAHDDGGWTPLMIAVSAGQAQAAHELVDAGADVNATNEKGQTPLQVLFYAASKNHLAIGRYLIEKGADINAKDRASQTPLHRAATTGSVSLLQLLLNPPAGRPKTRLNTADRAGNTPMHLAMESGHGEATVVLIDAGADRERQNSENQVPEEIDGVGGQEQKKVRQYVVSRVGPRE
ncbi:hypothetical protein QFC19_001591 [Naganishia cerealis]|uniref:Uncharacterized protein n=1 Tax=Naganishia cerealis TaxID=610337 RepID=A0ACC2WGL1_9TREE|nr:hypothetical protein QFC19_001591 [Naganishia cerealis]